MTHVDTHDGTLEVCNTKGQTSRKKARGWCLTINTYSTDDIISMKKSPAKICCFQTEVGENGNPHIQGVLYYENARSFDSIKKEFPRAHIEPMRNLQASCQYCTKNETWDYQIRYYRKDKKIIYDTNDKKDKKKWDEKEFLDKVKLSFESWYFEKIASESRSSPTALIGGAPPPSILRICPPLPATGDGLV